VTKVADRLGDAPSNRQAFLCRHCVQAPRIITEFTRPTSGESGSSGPSSYLEGFNPVNSLGSMPMSHSYLLVPSPSMRYLSPATLQLPTCLTSEYPPLAHLLHSNSISNGVCCLQIRPTCKTGPCTDHQGGEALGPFS
jgi:hypothetical protein